LNSDAMMHFRTGFARQETVTCFQGNMNLTSRVRMFDAVVNAQPEVNCLGGRSMGARAAVICANSRGEGGSGQGNIERLVLVSYPLHTEKEIRDGILLEIEGRTKVLFVSGERDEMCDLDRLEEVRKKMKARSWRIVVRGADHGMVVKRKVGTKDVGELVGEVIARWLRDNEDENVEGEIRWDEGGERAVWSGWVGEPKGHEEPKSESDGPTKSRGKDGSSGNLRGDRAAKRALNQEKTQNQAPGDSSSNKRQKTDMRSKSKGSR
jgi:predicted alpha/beta-hydrolase family hydrolase